MKKIVIQTEVTKMLADTFTPVGIYLRLRDRFRDTILLESTDSHASEKGLDDVLPHSGCNFANITSSDIGKKNDIAIQVLRSFINGKQ